MVLLGYVLSQNSDMENGVGRITTDSSSVETMPDEGDTVSRGDGRYIVTYKKVKESVETSSENTSGRKSNKAVTSDKNAKDTQAEQSTVGQHKAPPSPQAQQSSTESAASPSAEKTE